MIKFALTPQINEAGNGALLVMSVFAAGYFALYLLRAWRELENHRPFWRKFHYFYTYENKAALAMLTISGGGALKCWSEWYWLHAKNHPDGHSPDSSLVLIAFGVGTAIAVWGFVCLIRALSRYEWKPWTWIALSIFAVGFGLWFAL